MSGFTYELRKIFFHQKGLFYIVLVLLVSSLLLGMSDNPNNSAMEQYRNEYNWYLEKVNGQCTNEKALFLEEEARIINEASGNIDNLLDSFYAGEISESEYNKGIEENNKILENKNGFEVIYQQYLYICENDTNRYFLQTNGWAGLLGGGTLNFLLFIGILLLVTPVFCSEYSCQMDALILTSKEGRKSSIYKMLIIGVGVLFMCMSISLIEYGFYSIKYGLPNGDYPIQSLAYFANSSKSVSLFEGYIYITMLRCFGGIFLAVLLMFMSVVVKKYALTLLVGAVSVLIPYVGLQKTIIYRLPLPLPFLLGTDFFAGETVSSDVWSGEDLIVFAEVDITTIYTLLIVSMVLCILAIVWILRCNSNNWLMKARKHRKMASVALVLCLVLALAGCSNETGNQTVVSNSGATYDSLNYEVIKDPETQVLYLKDTTTGETMNLVRDPLFGTLSEENRVISYYVSSPYIYYTTLVTEQVTIASLAKQLGLNRSYLYEIFKEIKGISPQEYLTQLRIRKACALLQIPGVSVTSAACSVGYEPSVFSKAFKRVMGINPAAYKKQYKQ